MERGNVKKNVSTQNRMESDLVLLYDLVIICLKRLDTEKDPKMIKIYTNTLRWTTKKLQAYSRKTQIPFSLSPVENGTNTSATNDICSRVGE
jgi:hypothetical protein